MDVFWGDTQQSEFAEGVLLQPTGRPLTRGWVLPVHPQLRNGLAISPTNANLFYLNQEYQLITLNIATGQRTVVWPWGVHEAAPHYRICCFSIIDHYVVIGTDSGQLIVLDISTNHLKLAEIQIDHQARMVNYVKEYYRGKDLHIIVCSNNSTMRVFKMPNLELVSVIELGRATNSSALSPDGRWMVAVGDRSELYVFAAQNDRFHLKHVVPHIGDEIYGGNGSNMVAWEPHRPYRFAVANESGAILVYEHPCRKNWSPTPTYYLWGRGIAPFTHATKYPLETPVTPALRLGDGNHMASVKFVPIGNCGGAQNGEGEEQEGSSLLVACSVERYVHVFDLTRRLRQVIDLDNLRLVVALQQRPPRQTTPPGSLILPLLVDNNSSSGSSNSSGSSGSSGSSQSPVLATTTGDGSQDVMDDGNSEAEEEVEEEEDWRCDISGVATSLDFSKLYVSFETPGPGDLGQGNGFIVELAVNKMASLREQCVRYVKRNLHRWQDVDWESTLPASLLSELFSPYKFT